MSLSVCTILQGFFNLYVFQARPGSGLQWADVPADPEQSAPWTGRSESGLVLSMTATGTTVADRATTADTRRDTATHGNTVLSRKRVSGWVAEAPVFGF